MMGIKSNIDIKAFSLIHNRCCIDMDIEERIAEIMSTFCPREKSSTSLRPWLSFTTLSSTVNDTTWNTTMTSSGE